MPIPATRFRSRTIECRTETWIVHIRLNTSKCLRDFGPDDTDGRRLLPMTGFFTERDELAVGFRNSNVLHLSLPHDLRIRTPVRPGVVPAEPQTNAHSCLGKPSPRKIASQTQIAGCTHPHRAGLEHPATSPLHCQRRNSFGWEASRTKSCTQAMTPSTASRLMPTRSKLMLNSAPGLLAPLTTSAVNWKSWTKHRIYGNELMERNSMLETTYWLKMTAGPNSRLWGPRRQDVPYIRATPRGDAL